MLKLDLTERQADVALQMFCSWMEGTEAATRDVIADRSLDSPDQLLEVVNGMHNMYADVSDMANQLRRQLSE